MSGMLYKRSIDINDIIKIHVPTVGEIYDHEDDYYNIALSLTATPYDMMVQLDDVGVDFTTINEYELFCMLWRDLKEKDLGLIFEGLDVSKSVVAVNPQTGDAIVWDEESGLVIDRSLHTQIADCIRNILSLEKNDKRPGNEQARKYLIERERKKMRRRARQKHKESQLENNIVALVNTEQFPYTFDTVRDITIYQFNASLQQVAHKINFDNLMRGYYAGTIKLDKVPSQDKTWIRSVKQN